MISTLKGTIVERIDNILVIDVAGVGYGILVTQEDLANLKINEETKLYIYEHVREQSYDLFGFTSLPTKKLFEQLLTVSGIGPKMALSILSVGTINEVRQSIAEGNTKFLSVANGVGKKVAERLVVDLKDKVGLSASEDATTFLSSPSVNKFDEAQVALVSLGYSAQDAASSLQGIDINLSTEERLKIALRGK